MGGCKVAAVAQPALKSYYFEKGYVDLAHTIKEAWQHNIASILSHKDNLVEIARGSKAMVAKVFLLLVNALAMVAVIVFGSAATLAITALNVLFLLVFMFFVYVGFTAIWVVDRLYLLRNKIFTACHECKEKALIPTYICPSCGVKHTNLTPGVYGILLRRCQCGAKLPTTFFNGRKELDAECPFCESALMDRESRPICIPIVGGRSVGKTAFITAFSWQFIEEVAPAKGWEIEYYNKDKARIYEQIKQDYETGSTRMTERPQDVNQASSVSFSFFVKDEAFVPERLVHVYDIAGEVFTDNAENEVQKQYEYCQGVVLIIDPFAIPTVRHQYEQDLGPEDTAGIGAADINGIIDAFLGKLREVTGLSDSKMASVPLAVAISKIDSAGIDRLIGDEAAYQLMHSEGERFSNFFDAQDFLCRQFLRNNGMESFLSSINLMFRTNRFFACSAIGHPRDQGPYKPVGVLPIMEWIFKRADKKMAECWNDHTFTQTPAAIKFEKEEKRDAGE